MKVTLILPGWREATPPDKGRTLCSWVREMDWADRAPLPGLGHMIVFGFGDLRLSMKVERVEWRLGTNAGIRIESSRREIDEREHRRLVEARFEERPHADTS